MLCTGLYARYYICMSKSIGDMGDPGLPGRNGVPGKQGQQGMLLLFKKCLTKWRVKLQLT